MFPIEEDRVERLAKRVVIWAAIGAFVPIFWGVVGFLAFNANGSGWDLFWGIVYITCPPWLLPEGKWSVWITPIANAVLYGLVAFFVSVGFKALSKRR
jgi:hypothetical protein